MPGREGKVTNDSWTAKLANAISEITGRPVVLALEGVERESRQVAKSKGKQGENIELKMKYRSLIDVKYFAFGKI